MTKNEDILKQFEVIERQTLEVENVVEKNNYFTILFFSQLYTQLDTCQKFHPCMHLSIIQFYLLYISLCCENEINLIKSYTYFLVDFN